MVYCGVGVWYTPGDRGGGRLGFQSTHHPRVVNCMNRGVITRGDDSWGYIQHLPTDYNECR